MSLNHYIIVQPYSTGYWKIKKYYSIREDKQLYTISVAITNEELLLIKLQYNVSYIQKYDIYDYEIDDCENIIELLISLRKPNN